MSAAKSYAPDEMKHEGFIVTSYIMIELFAYMFGG